MTKRREDAPAVAAPVVEQPGTPEVHEAREAFERAVEREEEIRVGRHDVALGIANAEADRDAAEAEIERLRRRMARGEDLGPDALAETKAARADAEARREAAEARLVERAELLRHAEEVTAEARERLEAVLRREVAAADAQVKARMAEVERVRDDAARQYEVLSALHVLASQTGRGAGGGVFRDARVADLEKVLAKIRAAL